MSSGTDSTRARLIDVGILDPAPFHASYEAVALSLDAAASPVVVWGRARPHVSLGQCEARSVLESKLAVPVVRRALGGGAVWIDERQYCYVLIAPLAHVPRRPADWFEWGLRPAVATFCRFGLHVERVEEDLWLGGRKIAGSGAATLGACAVFASSFLMRFPAHRFAHCVRTTSTAYRAWLAAGLAQTMTDWESHQRPPGAGALGRAFRAAVSETLGWSLRLSPLTARERALREAALAEIAADEWDADRDPERSAIKLNARSFLTEIRCAQGTVRTLTVDGMVIRRNLETESYL